MMFKRLISIFKNKIIFFVSLQYVIFFIQFIGSMIIAARLGPYYMGIWGFLLLILQYYSYVSIGADYSLNVLLIQNKNNRKLEVEIVSSSLFIQGIQASIIILFTFIVSFVTIPYFEKYSFSSFIWLVCCISVIAQFNTIFLAIYRIRNDVRRMLFFQGIIPFLSLVIAVFLSKSYLIYFLLIVYILGNCLAFIYFIKGFRLFSFKDFSKPVMGIIIKKGFFLIISNTCILFIILSIRTIISSHYSVKEFGIFTFALTIATAVFALLEGFSFLVYPKLLDSFTTTNQQTATPKLNFIRMTYITLIYGVAYLALCFYPILIIPFPEYKSALPLLNFITLSLLMKYNTIGYPDTLIARDHEKQFSLFAAIALVVNIVSAIIAVKLFHVGFIYIIFSTFLAYLVYSIMVVWFGMKLYEDKSNNLLSELLPMRILLPYLFAIFSCIIFPGIVSSFVTLIIFILLNIKEIKEIKTFIIKLINTPDILHI